MAAKSKSPALKGIAGVLVAIVAWIAHHFGWIDLDKSKGGDAAGGRQETEETSSEGRSGDSSGATTKEKPSASEYTKPRDSEGRGEDGGDSEPASDGASQIAQLFNYQRSDVQVRGFGTVKFTLPDDNDPPRHQVFILEMSNGMTLKVAHNTDLAERVPLEKGDRVDFYAEYEYEERGGVLHWTHKTTRGSHAHGWLEHNGKRYE